ncbi:MAG: ATP-dependent protease subunit HslV [candidate division Zixibacteria bacterium]|jgi:ATP-dependent HslUV protease, peptidase subunit HslV|nr:ATP-dependent protease subunit HslV [candidate division Zixibacteria bacterium]
MFKATTILGLRHKGQTAIGGDGQVTFDDTIVKATARKIRTLNDGKIVAGFAGSSADAFTLFERFEAKLEDYPDNLPRAAVELAKDWRKDKYLRQLEALLAVMDKEHAMVISGSGDVLELEDGIVSIGSGGPYALAACRAMVAESKLSAEQIVKRSLEIAADICIYTNRHISIEILK